MFTCKRVAPAVDVGDDRMVDHEVDGDERVDLLRTPAERLDAVPHGGEVDDTRHAGEVLEEDPGRRVGDLPVAGGPVRKTCQCLHIARLHAHSVFVTKQVLEEELDRIGQPVEIGDASERRQPVNAVLPLTDLESVLGAEAVSSGHVACRLQIRLSGGEVGSFRIDSVTELAKRGHERQLLVRVESPFEQLGELHAVYVERLTHPLLAGDGQRRERTSAILGARLTAH